MENNKVQSNIVKDILDIANKATSNALKAVNTQLVIRNWLIGKRINEEILSTRSNNYGKGLIKQLSIQLSKCGSGFDQSNLHRYLKFYKLYKNIFDAPCQKSLLPWSAYRLLIEVKEKRKDIGMRIK